eukprot:Gb_15183 [translate_table: standard]
MMFPPFGVPSPVTAFDMSSVELAPTFQSSDKTTSYKFTNLRHVHIYVPFVLPIGTHHTVSNSAPAVVKGQCNISTLCREPLINHSDSNTQTYKYALLLQVCTNIKQLQQLHAHMLTSGLNQNVFLLAKLVNMYALCGTMGYARLLFDKANARNAFIWNAMISGYVRNGFYEEALELFYQMQLTGIWPDKYTVPSVIKACASLLSLQEGVRIHGYVLRSGFESDDVVSTALIDMYAKCGSVEIARQLFDKMSKRNVVTWNAMISAYAQNGYANEAFAIFKDMQLQNMKFNLTTVTSLLSVCTQLSALQQGKWLHGCIIRSGFEFDVIVGTALIDMYVKCGNINIARQLFDKMSERNVVSWSAMIAGYAQNGHANEALTLFNEMLLQDIKPNSCTMASLLPGFTHLSDLHQGEQIHGYIIRGGFGSDVVVGTTLIDMYAKCANIDIARHFFDEMPKRNVVSWSAMISCYVQNGQANEALALLIEMEIQGIKPTLITLMSILPACAHLSALQQGKQIHAFFIRNGFESNLAVTALVDMYAKCKSIDIARNLFDNLCERNLVSWNAMIAGYTQNGYANEALTLFREMLLQNIEPDSITMVNILPACANLSVLQQGKQIHSFIIRHGFEWDVFVVTALVHMYAKCNMIGVARRLFDKMSKRDVVSWNVMIAGYAKNGYTNEALALINEMQVYDIKPESITMVSVQM